MHTTVIDTQYFAQPTLTVAQSLIGQLLCRRVDQKVIRLPITELEAYDGFEDKASHAHRGRTARNAVMFGKPGHCYIYLCYGIHWLLNIVTQPQNYPAAILIRSAGTITGPGRLTRFLHIDSSLNNQPAIPEKGLWFERQNIEINPAAITRSPRIGVSYAGPEWAQKPYRFQLKT